VAPLPFRHCNGARFEAGAGFDFAGGEGVEGSGPESNATSMEFVTHSVT
jgi:hypothetical protein